jgi:hypothetical protein
LTDDDDDQFMFNSGIVTQNTPFYMDFVDRDGSIVFGTYGLDTFPVIVDNNFSSYYQTVYNSEFFKVRTTVNTYSRFQQIPEIEFFMFDNIDFPLTGQNTIYVIFKVSCPDIDMNKTNDDQVGYVGYCAQNYVIVNQFNVNILIKTLAVTPRSTVSEPPTNPTLYPYGLGNGPFLPDVLQSAVITAQIQYNDGDVLYFYFFPKVEPEQPQGVAFCGSTNTNAYSGIMKSPPIKQVPTYYRTQWAMSATVDTVQAQCEGNAPTMLMSTVRGEPYATIVSNAQNLPRYDITGNPLASQQGMLYWTDWNIDATTSEGFSVYSLPYSSGAVGNVYDQHNSVTGLIPPVPSGNVTYPNPLIRSTSCQNTNSTCFTPNDSTNTTGSNIDYSGIDQNHYYADGQNQVVLTPRLVFAPPHTFATSVGAVYCNETTQFIDVFVQEQMDKAVFEMQLECPVNVTAYWTYTVRYGISIAGLLEDFPCYERFITYVIVLTNFMASPAPVQRIDGCNRPDNCCYFLPINVFGNTADTEDIVNLATQCNQTTNLECAYEILVNPPPANATASSYGGLCPGQTYTFNIQSPAALVANRKQATTGNYFQYPWRGNTTYTLTLPRIGFQPLDVTTFNGNCAVEGNEVEFTTSYANFACNNAIDDQNPDPDCANNLLLAFVGTNAPDWPGGIATLADPYLLSPYNTDGPFTASYNLAFTIDLPNLWGSISPLPSIPNGVYDIYLWLSPAHQPYLSYSDAIAANPSNGIQTEVQVVFDSTNGLKVIRTTFTKPRCPATLNQTRQQPPADWAMALTFNVRDQNWNGPYNLSFTAPNGALLGFHQVVADSEEGCIIPCGALVENTTTACPQCDIYIRDVGITWTFYIGTGVASPNQQGLYLVAVKALATACAAGYTEFTVPLNTLTAQISCAPPTCSGATNGIVRGYVDGGTLIPLLHSDLIQNSDLTVAVARYTVGFTVFSGNTTLFYPNATLIGNAFAGTYEFNATDFNGCEAQAVCTISAVYAPLELEIVGVSEPNCTTDYGAITVAVVNRTFLPQELPLTLYALGPNQHPVNTTEGYILSDTNVHPGVNYLYTVCTALMCCSPYVNLTINAGTNLTVRIVPEQLPCATGQGSATGIITAIVDPPYLGNTFTWYFNEQLLPIDEATIEGAQTGAYRVVVTTLNGCTATDTYALPTTANFHVDILRSVPEITPAFIDGIMSGGNGPDYTVTTSPPDIIVGITVHNAGAGELYSSFHISMVPPAATIFIDVSDSRDCTVRVVSEGTNTPIPPVYPSPSASPVVVPKKDYTMQFTVIGSTLGVFLLFGLGLFLSQMYFMNRARIYAEISREKSRKKKG